MKAVVATFNQEKALVRASSVIIQLHRLIVYSTNQDQQHRDVAAAWAGAGDPSVSQLHQTDDAKLWRGPGENCENMSRVTWLITDYITSYN